jgi:hypothetical protein
MARACLACLLLAATGGCSGGHESPDPAPSAVPSSVEAFPEEPLVTGRAEVTVQAALMTVTRETCVPQERRVCSADGSQGWAPIGHPTRVVLVAARSRPAEGHTSWTALLRFSSGSRGALGRVTREAAGTGGVVVVMEGDRVLAAVPPPDLHGTTAALRDLDQPAAWDLVAAFGGR